MKSYRVYVPKYFNDGTPTPPEVLFAISNEIKEKFGGYSLNHFRLKGEKGHRLHYRQLYKDSLFYKFLFPWYWQKEVYTENREKGGVLETR